MCVAVGKMLVDIEFDVVVSQRLVFMEVTKEIVGDLCVSGIRRVGEMSDFDANVEIFGCVRRSLEARESNVGTKGMTSVRATRSHISGRHEEEFTVEKLIAYFRRSGIKFGEQDNLKNRCTVAPSCPLLCIWRVR